MPQDDVAARRPVRENDVRGNENAAPASVVTNAPAKTLTKRRPKSTPNDALPAATAGSRSRTSAADNDDNAAAVMTAHPKNGKKRARSNKAGDAFVPQAVEKQSKNKARNPAAASATSGGARAVGARGAGGASKVVHS